MSFFVPRFSDTELQRIYAGYRNEEYQLQRQSFESWYTPEVNSYLGGVIEAHFRKDNIMSMLHGNVDIATLLQVLDYGGDKGQFIPNEIGQDKRLVYDISGLQLVNNVKSVNPKDFIELKGTLDLVLCCHLLEHVPDPSSIIREITLLVKPGMFLYIEVPYDSPFAEKKTAREIIWERRRLMIQRMVSRIISDRPFYWMHEHINFFSPVALSQLVRKGGLEIIDMKQFSVTLNEDLKDLQSLAILAKRSNQSRVC